MEIQARQINIEVEFDPEADGCEEARRCNYQAVVDSIRFVRQEPGVGRGLEISAAKRRGENAQGQNL
jgi:hypothetical protein